MNSTYCFSVMFFCFSNIFYILTRYYSLKHFLVSKMIRSAPASPSHVGMSGLMTPESLSREGSPTESASGSPAGLNSQSAPGSPRNRNDGTLSYSL